MKVRIESVVTKDKESTCKRRKGRLVRKEKEIINSKVHID